MAWYFLVCAGLQWNDPDPYLWMPAYLLPLVLTFLDRRGYAMPRVARGAAIAYVLWAVYWNPVGGIQMPYEVEKEKGGLVIAAAWMGFLGWWGFHRK